MSLRPENTPRVTAPPWLGLLLLGFAGCGGNGTSNTAGNNAPSPTPPPGQSPIPTVTLSAAPQAINAGDAATLTWGSTDTTRCTASGAWTGEQATSGSRSTGTLGNTSTFTLSCIGPGGSATQSVTVFVNTGASICDAAGYSTEKMNLTAPYCLDMRDSDYLTYPTGNPIAVANNDARVTDELGASYTGGHAAKIVPPTVESYAGLGNFNFVSGSVGNRMNIRYLVYWGYDSVQTGVKLNIVNDGVSTRPMVISHELVSGQNTTFAHNYMVPTPSQNIENAVTIHDPGYPNNPSFFIAGSSASLASGNYAHQWVCWEFEVITGGDSPILNFYIHTRDGRVAFGPGNPYATHPWTAGAVDLTRASVGWYWGPDWNQTAESYVKISDVVISDSYIGPPPGFVQ